MIRIVATILLSSVVLAGCGKQMPADKADHRLRMMGMGLEEENGCTKCHNETATVLGPSWKAVAERYKDNPNARQILINSVKHGSSGKWARLTGGVDMPALGARVREKDIEQIVDYILSFTPRDTPASQASQ
jgi:cytochrome c